MVTKDTIKRPPSHKVLSGVGEVQALAMGPQMALWLSTSRGPSQGLLTVSPLHSKSKKYCQAPFLVLRLVTNRGLASVL